MNNNNQGENIMHLSSDYLKELEKEIGEVVKKISKKHNINNEMAFFSLIFSKNSSYYAGYVSNVEIDEGIINNLRGVADQFDLRYTHASA